MTGARPCPICGKPVDLDLPSFPFCGDRCCLVDLDNWLEGRYRIPGEPVKLPEAEEDEEETTGDRTEPARD